jgi:hypothetical protein
MLDLFKKHQIVHLKNVVRSANCLNWREISTLFQNLNNVDQESWCIEQDRRRAYQSPLAFLKPFLTSDCAYCSFLVQNDHAGYEETLNRLPMKELAETTLYYETALWFFFGRNPLNSDTLEGRPEHIDSVSHDGSWHYQLSGTKVWHVRPSSSLLEHARKHCPGKRLTMDSHFRLECQDGDVILLNTCLWFHRTVIPSQPLPSVSYARDFRLDPPSTQGEGGMTNVDGLYATETIKAGTVVFTENDMPNCELHRSSTNPNCEVVELDDGTNAVVSIRTIVSGEFFCVPDSDDESSDDHDG